MNLGEKLTEGKTKIVYAHTQDPALAVVVHKDGISAGDGARRNEIEGKGAISGRTTANVFHLLAARGVPTHFVSDPAPNVMVVKRCKMIPVEVVQRRLATGSFVRRHPDVAEGTRFDPPLLEFFFKDDANHDPQITDWEMVERGLVPAADLPALIEHARTTFTALEQAWAALGVVLVDLKIEFGYTGAGELVVADVIDNDSWRLWPGGDKEQMLDKQIYRNMREVTDEGLLLLKQRYEQVRDLTERFREA